MRTRLPRRTVTRAREHRAKPTEAEGLLWWKLRELNRRGYHFRRQVSFKGYYLDFAEHSANLAIELDGSQHGSADQIEHDAIRDRAIESEGYLVLRLANHEVFQDLDRVVDVILNTISQRRPPTPKIAARFLDLPTWGR